MKASIPQLTFTRFLAAMSIVLFHFGLNIFPFNIPVIHYAFSHANLGVSYFFVLSGFILTAVYNAENFSVRADKKKFWIARFARIYPVYFLALVLAVVPWLMYHSKIFSMTGAILHALLIQSWFPQYISTLNVPGWSLSVEALFYLLFPFFLLTFSKLSLRNVFLLALVIWLISFIVYYFFFGSKNENEIEYINFFSYTYPLVHLNNFLLGLAGGLAFKKDKPEFIKHNSSPILLITTGILIGLFFIPNPVVENGHAGLLAPLFLLFIISLSYNKSKLSGIISSPVLIFLGEISYGIYIFQVPLLGWFKGLTLKLSLPLSGAPYIYSYIFFLILFSGVIYLCFEKSVRTFINRSFSKN